MNSDILTELIAQQKRAKVNPFEPKHKAIMSKLNYTEQGYWDDVAYLLKMGYISKVSIGKANLTEINYEVVDAKIEEIDD